MLFESSVGSLNETYYSIVRFVNDQQKNQLQNYLEEYMKEWISKCSKSVIVLQSILFEFSHFQVDQVITNCNKIKTLAHSKHFVEVWRRIAVVSPTSRVVSPTLARAHMSVRQRLGSFRQGLESIRQRLSNN